MSFLAAPMLFGLALASLPVIIHLLNRRRFQVVDWAPMRYLKLTVRTNRRRIQIEQLLLLILRTLLIVILVAAVARPVLAKTGLGAWLARRNRVSRLIVIDTSLNTGYRVGGRSALDRAKAAVAEIVANSGGQDALTVLTTSPGAAPLAREAGPEATARVSAAVRDLKPTDAACDWSATFKQVDDALNTATFPDRQVILVTDLRRSGWRNGGSAITQLADHWAAGRVEARIVDVGSRETADVSLAKFVQEDALALPDVPVKLSAAVRNATAAPVAGASATLTVDGDRRPVLLPPLPAGTTTDVPLSVTLDRPGPHVLSLTLPDDALPGDNVRHLGVTVRDRLDLTIFDGRVGSGPFESAGDYVAVAATAGRSAWHVRRVAVDADPQQAAHPRPADVTVLADVASLPSSAVPELARLVRDGMGLIVFAGEQLDPAFYNEQLYRAGLMPCRIDRPIDAPVRGLVVDPLADSPAAPLARLAPAALNRVQTRRLLVVDPPARENDTVRVLARWNDAEAHPALIERRVGKGRVLLVTTTADRAWTDWPVDPTYVLLMRSATVALARPDAGDANATAGHPIEVRPDGVVSSPRISTPDDATPQPVAVVDGAIRSAAAATAGTYTLSWTDGAGVKQTRPVCVSYDPAAADLEPIDEGQLMRLLGSLRPTVVRFVPNQLAAGGAGRELWRTLAAVLLAGFVVETAFAAWVGRGR